MFTHWVVTFGSAGGSKRLYIPCYTTSSIRGRCGHVMIRHQTCQPPGDSSWIWALIEGIKMVISFFFKNKLVEIEPHVFCETLFAYYVNIIWTSLLSTYASQRSAYCNEQQDLCTQLFLYLVVNGVYFYFLRFIQRSAPLFFEWRESWSFLASLTIQMVRLKL